LNFNLAVSVAIFAVLKWELGIVEAIIVIMSVGLSVDFVVHFGVGYIHTEPSKKERESNNAQESDLPSVPLPNESNLNSESANPSRRYSCRFRKRHFRNLFVVCLGIHQYRLLYNKHQIEREARVIGSITRVGSAVFMAAFTTFAAGFSMTLSALCSFRQMGQFLMTISTFLFTFSSTLIAIVLCSSVDVMVICNILLFAAVCNHWSCR
jgi:predicted RND superfamily exporter protein